MQPSSDVLQKTRKDAVAIFAKGVEAVAPDAAVRRFCRRDDNLLTIGHQSFPLDAYQRVFVVGAGKATAPMAATLEEMLGEDLTAGIITVKYGHTAKLSKIETVEAGHPVPDENGEIGSGKILDLAGNAGEEDLLICLISGGGSALLPKTVPGVSLADKQKTTRILLACGASIHEINTLRKHLSVIKGGQLAKAAAPATVVSLILSDVVGDDLDVIASGPTVADNSTFADCLHILARYGVADQLPKPVFDHLVKGSNGRVAETPKVGDSVFHKTSNVVIGSNIEALLAAEKEAARRGYTTFVLSSMMEGETADVARMHTAIAREILKTGHPVPPPACILSGGETTVTLKGDGLGGRNQQFALCAAADIAGQRSVLILSGGTDGNDGPTDAAGAIVDNTTSQRAAAANVSMVEHLANNDSYHFFRTLGDLLITGPTNTNVMDLRIILIPE
jgi:hydroxypyruvate reductase